MNYSNFCFGIRSISFKFRVGGKLLELNGSLVIREELVYEELCNYGLVHWHCNHLHFLQTT